MGIVQVPEGRKIFPNLTVEENLDLGAYIEKAKIKRSESIDRVFHLFPPLKNRISQKAGTLSGGEQQMLAIAQGIMCCPKLLILDEPSLGLAPIVIEAIFMGILDINSQGTSILLAEQNIYYSLNICQRAYVLENGRLIMEGEGASLLKDEYVKKSYLGA
jgi:branched-chain amino acid transport system ATP-binding protein